MDRLTLVGHIADKGMLNTLEKNPFVKGMGRAKFPYDYTWYMMDGSVLQLASQSSDVRPLRYDFNPKNWKSKYQLDRHIMSILRLMSNVAITRLDIAMDIVGEDLGKHTWIDTQSRSRELHVDGTGKLETMYIGSPRSDERHRIYNKKKEREVMKDEAVVGIDHWWRVEVQLRAERAENFMEENPYKQVYCVNGSMKNVIVNVPYDVSTKAMLYYLSDFPDELTKLAQNTRLKYRNLIGALSEHVAPGESSFADVYENAKESIFDELRTWTECTERGLDWSGAPEEDEEFNQRGKEFTEWLREEKDDD